MKFRGFIGPAYQLDSSNVDAQACVNLYPEVIESGTGKAEQVAYLRGTPGLEAFEEVGDGPIRCVHVDSIGRIFVVSGNQFISLSKKVDWRYQFTATSPAAKTFVDADIDVTSNEITITAHGFTTGLLVRFSGTGTYPSPLDVGIDYYVIRVDADTIKVADSLEDAYAGTAIDITDDGTISTNTFTPQSYQTASNVKHSLINFSTGMFTAPAHGFVEGLAVQFKASGLFADGISEDTTYYIANRSDDTFQLATSFANALAGTTISLTDIADAWNVKLMGSLGQYGGDPITLAASTGLVKAASMSLGGNGTDSSTIFVDGVNNYLLRDDEGDQSLAYLGATFFARAIFDITNDITVQSAEAVDELVSRSSIQISDQESSVIADVDQIVINLDKNTVDATGEITYELNIYRYPGQTLTTAELVDFLMTPGSPPSAISGKTIIFGDYDNIAAPPAGTTRDENLSSSRFTFTGGGSQLTSSAFGTPVEMSFTKISVAGEGLGSVPTATDIVWSDGYFIVNQSGTNKFFVSDLQGFTIDALSFASSEGSPDILIALQVLNRYLYMFNEKTTEVFANTGNADFPFERIQGGFIEVGCAAAGSVAKAGPVLCWLGRSEDGEGIVYAIEGLQPQRISTHAIEQAIRGYADTSSAVAYSYQSGGHMFYVLSFDEATWVYDLSTKLWHQRAYTNAGELERHRAQHCAYVPSQKIHLVGDYETNQLYTMSEDVYSDDGNAITRLRAFPYISNGRNRMFCSSLQIDMETGIGLDGGVQGSSPTVMLDWSNDGGHTWSSESWALADAGSGAIGDYSKRVIWNRLGSFRSRVFRIKITDPVKVRLIDAQIEIEGGNS